MGHYPDSRSIESPLAADRSAARADHPAKVAFASFIGTTVEWYDYFIFGTAAVLVLDQQFFPELDPLAGQMASLATFAVSFVARPVGGVVFGHFGDRLSRKNMLVLSLLLMGGATFLIGLLPGYTSIGLAAPALLVLLRFIQGLAVGGEWGGAVVMAVEHAPPTRRAFFGSWPQAGVPAGLALASGVFFLAQLLPDEQFNSWGWRIPFLASAVLVVVGLVIRLRITESPELAAVMEAEDEARIPFTALMRTSKKSLLIGVFSLVGSNTLFYVVAVFLLAYAPDATPLTRGEILIAVPIGASLDIIAIPLAAVFADRHGKRTVMLVGSAVTAAAAIPIFLLINTGTFLGAVLAMIVAFPIAHSFVYATGAGFITGLFDPRVRYTGSSISYQIGGLIASAPAPLLSTLLYAKFSWFAVALYLVAANAVAAAFVAFADNSRR